MNKDLPMQNSFVFVWVHGVGMEGKKICRKKGLELVCLHVYFRRGGSRQGRLKEQTVERGSIAYELWSQTLQTVILAPPLINCMAGQIV